jgi:hypothetical protein
MTRYKARVLTTGRVVGGDHSKVLIAPWQGPRLAISLPQDRQIVQGGASTNVALGDEKVFPRGSYHRARGNSLFRARG